MSMTVVKKVSLHTADGRFVTEITMPAFEILPEGVFWGERLFFWREDAEQYREGIMWVCRPS